jgi:hypothetical protein
MARAWGRSLLVAGCTALSVACIGWAVPVAAASQPVPKMTVHDPTGDGFSGASDLTGVGILQNATGTTFGVTVPAPVDPITDAFWTVHFAGLQWFVDRDRNGTIDYDVVMLYSTSTHQMSAWVAALPSMTKLCDATPQFVAGVGYRVFAPSGCLPHLGQVRFQAVMQYGGFELPPVDPYTPPQFIPASPDKAPANDLSKPIDVQQAVAVHHRNGYWMLGADGHVYPFGDAQGFSGLVPDAAAMVPRHDATGYWIVNHAGLVFAFGKAKYFGGAPPLAFGEVVSTISATADDGGYWLFTNRGRALPYGDAHFYGDMSRTVLNGPIVASVATATGHGYYMVGSDGGIFAFGDARFHGSTGGLHLNRPVVGIAPTPGGGGYWLVASDGGVFAFDAPFRGSMGATHLNQPVNGLVAFGNGYLMVASDGGIFDFSDTHFLGSLAANPPAAPIVGVAAFAT